MLILKVMRLKQLTNYAFILKVVRENYTPKYTSHKFPIEGPNYLPMNWYKFLIPVIIKHV